MIMTKLDPNKLVMVAAVLGLAALAAFSGYRLEIGTNGLKFENGQSQVAPLR